ncbi:hypothetical protein FD755_019641 [Muntiacus reevesi]|uniref:Centlein n=1 Tax=Muntiacus reevesi TaxID=9886 RepID=A0A5N3X886_MUNRE|nr:hypothetical protein FD755_019641 [Muntiacus reevesi]
MVPLSSICYFNINSSQTIKNVFYSIQKSLLKRNWGAWWAAVSGVAQKAKRVGKFSEGKRESGLTQEINDLVKRKMAVDEENAFLRREFSDLQKKFKDKSQEVKECVQNKEEQNSLVIKTLKEENEKLSTHCADLLNDLEKLRKQEAHWRKEKFSIDAKVKELQELQNLYKQNSAHTAQQAELIQQLQVLNMDTQKVLRNQEDVHTAESISYQKLYNELHICFETTKSSEAMLRQSVVTLQDQLFQKEQENAKLKEKLQQSQEALYPLSRECDSDLSEQNQENDELRDAHEKRKERLQMLQTNYRAVKEQLKQWEEGSGIMNLQEELDKLKVHMSVDKATIQELNTFMAERREEQLFRHDEDDGVKKSTPEKNWKEMSEQTLQKVIELENRLKSFEKRSRKLKEGNKNLIKENDFLKSLVKELQEDAQTREKELEQLKKGSKGAEKDKAKLEAKISELEMEVVSLRRQVAEANELRNENEELMNSMEKLQHSADKAKSEMATTEARSGSGQSDYKTTTTKVKFKTAKKKCSVGRYHTVLNHSIKVMSNVFENLSKDDWEDMSESSDSETQNLRNLGTIIVETSQKISPTEDRRDQKESDQTEDSQMQGKEIVQIYPNVDDKTPKTYFHKNAKKSALQKKNSSIQKTSHTAGPTRVNREKWKNITAQKSNSNVVLLRERIVSLQKQNSVLLNAKKAAELAVKEYKEVNEKLLHQQQVSDQRFQTSRQTIKRDITMKRHLIEDLKFRQKVNLESNESINEMLENLEKKVRTLTEECSNKKVSIDSLKQRLSVAVKEKSQYEEMYQQTKEELEKKALVRELQNDVHLIRRQIRELKKMQKNRDACKTSTHKAQTLAASILNISRSDLEEILDTEDEAEIERTKTDAENDKEWLLYIRKLLEGQLPFATYLLEAILEKINEKKRLVEEYFTVMKDTR